MKHTVPWNVTNIPTEAREAARAAAQREGITVGEWLTRRILAESALGKSAEMAGDPLLPPQRDEDSGARSARADPDAESRFGRIDEALRAMTRRLDSNERLQGEAQRAMSVAAGEINAATHDQAQAFQHLTARIDAVERQADNAGLRDAVRGLHQGLSRLADQIAAAASDSSGQIATLGGTVEALDGKVAAGRAETQAAGQALSERIAALDARIKQAEDVIASALRFEARLKRIEERIASSPSSEEVQIKIEAGVHSAEARMQDALDRHLAAMNASLEQFSVRLEKAESRRNSEDAIEDSLRGLSTRIEGFERQQRDALGKFEASLGETAKRIAMVETAMPLEGPLPPARLPDSTATMPDLEHEADSEALPFPGITEPSEDEGAEGAAAPDASETTSFLEPPPAPSSAENYLAQARRAAHAAAEGQQEPGRPTHRARASRDGEAFIWNESDKKPRWASQPIILAALILLAIAAGFQVVRNIWRQPDVAAAALPKSAAVDGPNGTSVAVPSAIVEIPSPAPAILPEATVSPSQRPALAPAAQPASLTVPQNPRELPADVARGAIALPPATPPSSAAAPRSAVPALNSSGTPLSRLTAQAVSGDVKAAMALGVKYADGDGIPANDQEAARWLQKAAEAGEPVAQYRLGTFYEKGRGFDADQARALHWYSEAAKRGNRKAMHNLAVAYANGAGGKKNFAEAVHWFRAAAELGLTDSQFNLAVLYERGLGVPASLSEAYKWYAIAAARGDVESKARVEALATQISGPDRIAADRIARGYKPQPLNVAANDGPAITSN